MQHCGGKGGGSASDHPHPTSWMSTSLRGVCHGMCIGEQNDHFGPPVLFGLIKIWSNFRVNVVVNFLSQVIFVFLLFLSMVMYANEVETKEK